MSEERNELRMELIQLHIDNVRNQGLEEEAQFFEKCAWGFYRTLNAFANGHAYLDSEELKEERMTNKGAMHVTKYTIDFWAKQLGLERQSDESVLDAAASDREYHRTHTS